MAVNRPIDRPAWRALAAHHEQLKGAHLRQLFKDDPGRAERYSAEAAGLFLDYSKNRITDETLRLLQQLAVEQGVVARRDAMFRGEAINTTERRSVLHVALRAPRDAHIMAEGKDVVPEVHAVLDRMGAFAARVRDGSWTGHTGKRIRTVINIGIGGSYLGAGDGLAGAAGVAGRRSLKCRFVSNMMGSELRRGDAGAGRGGDAVRHFFQDLHDVGDDDQRRHGAGLGGGRAGFRRRGGEAFRCRLHQRSRGAGNSALIPATCSASGTGWAAAIRSNRRSDCPP